MTTSQRKRRAKLNLRIGRMIKQCALSSLDVRVWDPMPAVGREFGSPDFDRLMEEDLRQGKGVFDPALAIGFHTRRDGLPNDKPVVPATFDAPLPGAPPVCVEAPGGQLDQLQTRQP